MKFALTWSARETESEVNKKTTGKGRPAAKATKPHRQAAKTNPKPKTQALRTSAKKSTTAEKIAARKHHPTMKHPPKPAKASTTTDKSTKHVAKPSGPIAPEIKAVKTAAESKAASAADPKLKAAAKPDPKLQLQKKNGAAAPGEAPQTPAPAKDDPDAPLLDMSDAAVRKMVTRAKQRGYVTYDELNRVLPSDKVSSEQIEDTMAMLNEMGINVI